jgi:DNA transposition AAA+ family ATPase
MSDGKVIDYRAAQRREEEAWRNPQLRDAAILDRLTAMQAAGIKPQRIAVEAGVKLEALEAWWGGERSKDVTTALSDWITAVDRDVSAKSGDFVMTPTAARIVRVFEQARASKGASARRGVALVFGASGAGKTETAKWYARMEPNVAYVTVDGERLTWVELMKGVCNELGQFGQPAVGEKLRDAIVRCIRPGGLLIFDQAHLIRVAVMEQLMIFPDEYGIGVAFLGNARGYKALMDAKLAQITSRIAGASVFVEIPSDDDVDALMEAREIGGRAEREFCQLIGRQDGGLRYLDDTVRNAWKIARVSGAPKPDVRMLKLGANQAGCWGGA